MDISNVINGASGGIGKQILIWTVGGAISMFVANQVRLFLNGVKNRANEKIRGEINNIQDPNLREAARYVVRYVADQFPDISGDQKLQMAIAKIQEIVPDVLVSDKDLKDLIESAYTEFKNELKMV